MLANGNGTIIIDGVSSVKPMYKYNETDAVECKFYIAHEEDGIWDENGERLRYGVSASGAIRVNGSIDGYIVLPIGLHEATVYNITGNANPVNNVVYLSSVFDESGDIKALKNNITAVTYAGDDGVFNFKNVQNSNGIVSAWMCVSAKDIADITIESLSCDKEVVNYNQDVGQLLTYDILEPEGEYNKPKFTISGKCSKDIEKVYLSYIEDVDDANNVPVLLQNYCTVATFPSDSDNTEDENQEATELMDGAESTEGEDGQDSDIKKFEIQYTGKCGVDYIIWAISNSGGTLSADSIEVEEDVSASTCLSGDTLITMADGSKRRMDTLCVGDIVLSRNGIPSRIHTVKRNHFSDYHTLYYFEDGTVIDETHPHRFYNVDQGFWQRLQLWNIGDHAINQDGVEVALVSVEHIDEQIEMFGIWTDDGTYYANGLLSGAAFCNKELLAEATAEQAVDMMLSVDESWLLQLMGLEGVLPL